MAKSASTSSLAIKSSAGATMMGGGAGGGSSYFDGLIDEVRIYDGALSANEVSRLYDDARLGHFYDDNGNLTTRGSETLVFDVQNRLVSWIDGTDTSTFVYDADGSRVAKTESGTTHHYVNGLYEVDVTASETTVSYFFGGALVAVKKGADLRYVHQGHLSSTAVTTDTAGALFSSETYLPYGETRAFSGIQPTERRYTGQRLDMGFGLYFYNARPRSLGEGLTCLGCVT